jgi:hypothetical protein
MADGLLASGLNWVDQQKQALAARLGLLANNPDEFGRQLAAEARQRAGVGLLGEPKTAQEMASGAWINSPYGQQAMQAGSGFAGTTIGKPINLWHGSKDIRWIDKGDVFNPSLTANMPSNYMWASPKENIAKTYAGISDMQLEKYSSGLGSKPSEFAGIRPVVLQKDANILNVKDVKKSAKDLGIEFAGDNALENLLNAAKDKGYDAVRMIMDGGNIAILNPKVAKF